MPGAALTNLVIGVVEFVDFLNGHPGDDSRIAAAVAGSLVLVAVLGAARAPTVRVWRAQDGQLLRKGTWLTAVLWVRAAGKTPSARSRSVSRRSRWASQRP